MNILYIAYSCSPYHGSEDKIGWSIPVESAKTNCVFVITKEEQREYIEDYLRKNPLENIQFFYTDIPKGYKRLFSGAIYTGRLNIWNRRAYQIAKRICETEKIDIIHQITPVEFRSIGEYGKIPGVKFVCGPIAGGQKIPVGLNHYLTRRQACIEFIGDIVNVCCREWIKISGKLKNCDYLLFANRETQEYLAPCMPRALGCEVIPDVSVDAQELVHADRHKEDRICRFLVAGRMTYRKGHELLLDALCLIPDKLNYHVFFVGDGPQREMLIQKVRELGLEEKVTFTGTIPYERMAALYDSVDVLVVPSFREATGTVILEAMARELPVVTINRFGGRILLCEETGWLYDGGSREQILSSLTEALTDCIVRPEEATRRGRNAAQKAWNYTWDRRMQAYQRIYNNVCLREDLRKTELSI